MKLNKAERTRREVARLTREINIREETLDWMNENGIGSTEAWDKLYLDVAGYKALRRAVENG